MAAKKRFYKSVALASDECGFSIQLDGKDVLSPAGRLLHLPNVALAEAIAKEWKAQKDEIDPPSMPLFSLAVTVVDRIIPQSDAMIAELSSYGGNDLLCYRDDQDDLAIRQQELWQPWLDHLAKNSDIHLRIGTGIMPIFQPDAGKFIPLIAAYNNWRLGMLHRVTSLSGSLVLGLVFVDGVIDIDRMFALSFLDELWQNEKWGKDFEAIDRHKVLRAELQDVLCFLLLLNYKTAV
ncbi:chaperone [Candidatus Puniceispirillum sp.]|nr:chaperone [Candidatus Puniceispirillum sp.]